MKRISLIGALVWAAGCATAPAWPGDVPRSDGLSPRSFKARFQAFGASHFHDPHFAGPPPLQIRDCEDPQPNQSYICHYSIGSVVYLDAEAEVGTDRLGSINLTWDGTAGRQDLLAETAGFVVGTLSPEAPSDTWRDVARTIYATLPTRPPFPKIHQEWRIGSWVYRFVHEGRYGSRDMVQFTSTRVIP